MYIRNRCHPHIFIMLFIILPFGHTGTAKAMTVFDPTNYAENLLAAQEAVKQTQSMIEQLKTQVMQYERMLKDAMNLNSYITGDLKKYMSGLENFQKNILGSTGSLFGGGGGSSGGVNLTNAIKEFYGPSQMTTNMAKYSTRDSILNAQTSELKASALTKAYADASLLVVDEQIDSMKDFITRFESALDDTRNAEGQQQAIQAQTEVLSLVLELMSKMHQLMLANSAMDAACNEAVIAQETRERMVTAIVAGNSEISNIPTGASAADTGAKEHRFFE